MRVLMSGQTRPLRLSRAALGLASGLALAACSTSSVGATSQSNAQDQAAPASRPAPAVKPTLVSQTVQPAGNRPKTIVQLQPLRSTATARLANGMPVRLISLNPGVNAWYLLQTGTSGARDLKSYHLQNTDPRGQSVALAPDGSLLIGGAVSCNLLGGPRPAIESARASGLPFVPVCGGRLFLRNTFYNTAAARDRSAAFLQAHVWHGTQLVQFNRASFARSAASRAPAVRPAGPAPALTVPGPRPVISARIGLGLAGAANDRMRLGLWYPVGGIKGVFASAMRPEAIAPAVLKGPGYANKLDRVEARAPAYFIAFDLSRYAIGYTLGNHAPAVDWSRRPPANVRIPGWPGPDGIGNARPLVRLGMISPTLTSRAVAVFAGGYKRIQGAFKWGAFSQKNAGTHYGFLQDGTIFSKLHAGLSTVYGLTDGTIGMKTWTRADDRLLPKLLFARQNGVPLIAPDPKTGKSIPPYDVVEWGRANWSGSASGKLRTERAGACMAVAHGKRYLIYGLFTTATPSAMARTFQAYGCRYAMGLDMNAPVLTYQALYVHQGNRIVVEHLVPSMAQSDMRDAQGNALPRALAFPDKRDFLYLYSK